MSISMCRVENIWKTKHGWQNISMYLKLAKWDGAVWMHLAKITCLLIYILFADYMTAISVVPNKQRQILG